MNSLARSFLARNHRSVLCKQLAKPSHRLALVQSSQQPSPEMFKLRLSGFISFGLQGFQNVCWRHSKESILTDIEDT